LAELINSIHVKGTAQDIVLSSWSH